MKKSGICEKESVFILQGGACGDGDHTGVAREDLFGSLGLGLLSQEGDHGDDDETHQHGQHTGIDGGAAEVSQYGILEGDLENGVDYELVRVMPRPVTKLTQTAALVVFFQYRP